MSHFRKMSLEVGKGWRERARNKIGDADNVWPGGVTNEDDQGGKGRELVALLAEITLSVWGII